MPVQLPPGPVLLRAALARLPLAAGRWLVAPRLEGIPFADYAVLDGAGVVTVVYLVTDTAKRIRWLGQASRQGELFARLADHAGDPGKRAAFSTVRYLHLDDYTPRAALDAIEGRCADLLALRGVMGRRQWPAADGWANLVA